MTLAPKLTSHDRRINWSVDAPRLVRLVRALAPTPGATTTFRGRPMKILAARVQSGDRTPEPWSPEAGSFGVLLDGPDGPSVETGHGHLSLLEVAPAGRKRMPAAEWARGARIQPGERLG